MKIFTAKIRVLLVSTVVAGACAGAARAGTDFNPQPDPPGFGLVTLAVNQTIRLNVHCFAHQIGEFPPDPCSGQVMFHDASGKQIKAAGYHLQPGVSRFLQFTFVASGDVSRLGIAPCMIPAPGGVAIPSVEVLDETGRVLQFENPAAARMTDFNNGPTNPGVLAGFNPQPDPPGFGSMTLNADQFIRMNVSCFAHPIGSAPPDPCRGVVFFHDANGHVVLRDVYDLAPGQTALFQFAPMSTNKDAQFIINPSVLPDPGGRAVPNVEVVDTPTGNTLHLANPAVARMSAFERR